MFDDAIGTRTTQVLTRLLATSSPLNSVLHRELAVRAGTDAQVVAKLPIVEIVAALPSNLRVR